MFCFKFDIDIDIETTEVSRKRQKTDVVVCSKSRVQLIIDELVRINSENPEYQKYAEQFQDVELTARMVAVCILIKFDFLDKNSIFKSEKLQTSTINRALKSFNSKTE